MPDSSGRIRPVAFNCRIPWHEPLPDGPCKGCPDVEHCGSVGCAVGVSKASVAREDSANE